jgi:hypothetical protein
MSTRAALFATFALLAGAAGAVHAEPCVEGKECICPAGKKCTYKVGPVSAEVDQICLREFSRPDKPIVPTTPFVCVAPAAPGQPTSITVNNQRPLDAGHLILEAVALDNDRAPAAVSSAGPIRAALLEATSPPRLLEVAEILEQAAQLQLQAAEILRSEQARLGAKLP